MLRKILETIGVRYLIAILNLLLIIINGKVLGLEGMGVIGLVYASANIALIFTSILCSNTIVYFMNRYDFRYVFWPAYIWTFLGAGLACIAMELFGMNPEGYGIEVYGLAILMSFVGVNARGLLGKEQIKAYNLTYLIQGVGMFIITLFIYFIIDMKNPDGYILALYLTNGFAWGASLLLLAKIFKNQKDKPKASPASIPRLIQEMFIYGIWSSADNLAEGLVTRLNYFLIQRLGGYAQVGLLEAGTKVSESVWHISRSTSSLAYSQIAKTNDAELQRTLTLQFFKLTFVALTLVMGIIICLPEWVYTKYLFTPEFQGIRNVILGLSVGVVALGANSLLSHYFIGTGRVKYSTASSTIGLIALLIAGAILIPHYGVTGAAISTSMAYSAMLTFSSIVFRKITKTRFREFFPMKADFEQIFQKITR